MARLRRLARWSAAGISAILVLAAIGAVVIQTEWFKEWLRHKLITQAGTFLDADLRVGRLGGSLWTGVTLDDVELWDRQGQVLRADQIRVSYDPITLAKRHWIIDHVVIDHATVALAESAAGWNVAHLARPRAPGGKPATIAIRRLELLHSTVTIAPANGKTRTLSAVDLDTALTVTGGSAALTVASLQAHDDATGISLREFSGEASDNFRTFTAQFVAESPAMRLAGSARSDEADGARRLTANADVSHVDLAVLTGQPQFASDLTGRVSATANVPTNGGASRLDFSFAGPANTAFNYTAQRIDATGTFANGVVSFDANVAAYSARASVNGAIRLPKGSAPIGFTGRGAYAGLNVRQLPASLHLPLLETRLAGRYQATVDAAGWRADTTFTSATIEGATLAPGTRAAIDASRGVVTYGATGTVSHLNLPRIGRAVPVPALNAARFDGDVSGSFMVAGSSSPSKPAALFGRATLADSTLSGTHVGALDATVTLANRRLTIAADGDFDALNDGTIGLTSLPVVASGSVNGWFAIADLDRPLDPDNVEGNLRLQLGPSSLRGVPLESAIVDGQLLDGLATIRALDVKTAEASLHATGAIGLHESTNTTGVTVTTEVHERTFVNRTLQWPIAGAGSLDATITGSLDSPSIAGTLTVYQAAYRDVASALTTTAHFAVDWPDRQADTLRWQADSDTAFATIGGTEIQRLIAKGSGGLRVMTVDVQADQPTRSLGVQGQVTLEPESRDLVLSKLALTTQDVAWSLPAGQSAVVRYGGERVDVEGLALIRGDQQILIDGGFNLETPAGGGSAERAGLEVRIQNVQLADVNHVLLGTRQLTGLINGTVKVTGSRQAPVIGADVTFRDGTVEAVPYASVQARGQYADDQASIDVLLDQAPGASVRAVGTVPFGSGDAGRTMDVRVSGGPVNLGLVQALTAEIDAVQGDAAVDLHITGTVASPLVNGTATLANGGFVVKATGVQYKSIEAALEFSGSHLAIQQLQVADANGDLLTASGGLDVLGEAAARVIDVRVQASKVSVLNNQYGIAEMNADLRVSGTLGALVVRGTATLDSGRLEVAQILERAVATPYSTEAQAAPGTPVKAPDDSSFLSRADIAVQLHLPDNLVLRGRGLRVSNGGFGIGDMNIVTGGSFDVARKPGQDLDVVGTLEVVRGSYSFQGRRFDIERGSDVRFRGGTPTDPFLNVNATREVSGITAEVRLRGSARAPELTLASRPPLDEGDILSLIVFNQPINALGSAERVNLGERAASIAAGAITTPLSDSIAQALNLDVFEIQAPTSSASTGAVTVGSQIGSRIFVGLRQQFGHDEASMLTLEYRVNEMLRFVTSIARGTLQAHATRRMDRGGVDVIFLIRY